MTDDAAGTGHIPFLHVVADSIPRAHYRAMKGGVDPRALVQARHVAVAHVVGEHVDDVGGCDHRWALCAWIERHCRRGVKTMGGNHLTVPSRPQYLPARPLGILVIANGEIICVRAVQLQTDLVGSMVHEDNGPQRR